MMNLNDYLNPPGNDLNSYRKGEFGKQIVLQYDDLSNVPLKEGDIAIAGLPFHIDNKLKPIESPDLVRKELYGLSLPGELKCNIVDIGDLKQGKDIRDTIYSLKALTSLLREAGIFTLLIGGSGILNLGILMSLESHLKMYSYTMAEPWYSLVDFESYELINFESLNYYNLGNQSYYLTKKQKEWVRKYHYETFRLGRIRSDLDGAEPILRSSDGSCISVNAIRNSNAPGQEPAYPNGFYNEEVCQLARYAGISNHLGVFGIFDYFPENDVHQVTAKLIAQMLWFSIEGYLLRYREHPYSDRHFKKFLVSLDDHKLTFYKSERTSRWWMEIPYKGGTKNYVYPCSQTDYETACRHELPERWLHTYQKLNFTYDNG